MDGMGPFSSGECTGSGSGDGDGDGDAQVGSYAIVDLKVHDRLLVPPAIRPRKTSMSMSDTDRHPLMGYAEGEDSDSEGPCPVMPQKHRACNTGRRS